MKVLLVYPNLMLVTQLPNNIALLAACLKEAGHKVSLFDTTFYRTESIANEEIRMKRGHVKPFDIEYFYKQLEETDIYNDFRHSIKSYQPDLVAISFLDDTKSLGLKLARIAKENDIPVVGGNVYAIFATMHLLRSGVIDYVCVGEGEETLPMLATTLESEKSVHDIPNLVYRDGNKHIQTPLANPVDINFLPFEDYSIFDERHFIRPFEGKKQYSVPINIDRGCLFKCAFCAAPRIRSRYWGYYRVKSIGRIREELQHQLKYYPKIDFIYFNSENFLMHSNDWLEKFVNMYKEFDIPFWCQTSIQSVSHNNVEMLNRMPIVKTSVGFEHGNDEFRKKVLDKWFTNWQVDEAMRCFEEYGISVGVNNIIGFPDETRELVFDTIRLNRKYPQTTVNGFVYQPYRGTKLRAYCLLKGYITDETETNTLFGKSVLNMPQFLANEIDALVDTFILYIKLPENRWDEVKQSEKDVDKLIELREEVVI